MTARRQISIAECGLLTRRNAMAYCGQLGEERFDREVAPHCPPRFIGQERFYDRDDLDAWRKGLPIDRLGRTRRSTAITAPPASGSRPTPTLTRKPSSTR
jgi:hypothetical protein